MTFSKTGDTRVLMEMLTRMRPAGSKTERMFIREYLAPLGLLCDRVGNLYKRIGDAPILWSCHTDTVHKVGGNQLVALDGETVTLAAKSASTCLGADDTAGIWLMREMILAERPGLYVFHRGEEIGGVGSSYVAKHTPELLRGIKAAIALDRKGYTSVITHQWGRCCSDVFAKSLAAELGMGFRPDDSGVFTDTANYVDLVGECTNISVGYFSQHTPSECLDVGFLVQLRAVLLSFDWRNLEFSRQPGELDPIDWSGSVFGSDTFPDDGSKLTMRELVADYPSEVADILQDYGYDVHMLAQQIFDRGGVLGRR